MLPRRLPPFALLSLGVGRNGRHQQHCSDGKQHPGAHGASVRPCSLVSESEASQQEQLNQSRQPAWKAQERPALCLLRASRTAPIALILHARGEEGGIQEGILKHGGSEGSGDTSTGTKREMSRYVQAGSWEHGGSTTDHSVHMLGRLAAFI